jgi:hypothetical protein
MSLCNILPLVSKQQLLHIWHASMDTILLQFKQHVLYHDIFNNLLSNILDGA